MHYSYVRYGCKLISSSKFAFLAPFLLLNSIGCGLLPLQATGRSRGLPTFHFIH
jgi:hypothetical protein